MRVGSLFSGIGGLDLGLERAGMQVVWQCELDPFCRKVLAKHWPDVPCYEDVKVIDASVPEIDLLCGGFPCQDVSHASRTKTGLCGDRSGLWHQFARIIRILRPRIVIVENVLALRDRGLGIVLRDLALLRYDASWSSFSACTVGGSHMRWRLFIVAYSDQINGAAWLGSFDREIQRQAKSKEEYTRKGHEEWLLSTSRVDRNSFGVPNRHDRVGSLGNAVHVDCSEVIGRAIMEITV